ncbi:MAG: hypothetical protein K0S93_48 [Nitrososphaeraceae archaeon]|jgi:hypothetical protein|nr:hypothetical protein [Nitrososphaeraceae archaeon]
MNQVKFYQSKDGKYLMMTEYVDEGFIRTTHFKLMSDPDLSVGVNPKSLNKFIEFQKLTEIE